MGETTADFEADRRRFAALVVVAAGLIAIVGLVWSPGAKGANAASPDRHAAATSQQTQAPPTAPPSSAVDDADLSFEGSADPVITHPIPVPLPSAGLGGIALLITMGLWRSAGLRSTRRLH